MSAPPLTGEARLLPALRVEILRREPLFERGFAPWPFRVDDREPGRVAVLALHHHVLAEQPFVLEAETNRRAFRWLVAVVALPLVAAIAKRKSIIADQIHSLRRHARALERGRIGDPADFKHAVRGADLHHPEMAFGLAIRLVDHGERADIRFLHHGIEQRVVFGAAPGRRRRQIVPNLIRTRQRCREIIAVSCDFKRLKPAIAPLQNFAVRKRRRGPVLQIAHASRAALSLLKKPLSSPPFAASLKPSNEPCSAIDLAVRMKPPQAERASAPPTLMRRTPIAAMSATVCPNAAPLRKFTGLGATAFTTASIWSGVLIPGAYSTSAPAAA